jgi:hypothetical protein
MKRFFTTLGILFVSLGAGCPGDSTGPEVEETIVSCPAAETFCPTGSSQLGYSGGNGAPSITPTNTQTTVSTSSSSQSVFGSTNATTNGQWFIIINDELRSSGILAVEGGVYSGEIPLFCGTQQVALSFTAGGNRAYFRTNVTQTGCTAAQFRVQLSWDTDDSDIDLHLLRPGGTTNNSLTDCYYANCQGGGLDWGTAGAAGDPLLDVDDVFGFGPENIVIGSGAETGNFRVVVRNFDGSPATRATVKIFINEIEVQRFTSQTLDSGVRDYWQVANVNVVTGTVSAINTYSVAAPARVFGERKTKK